MIKTENRFNEEMGIRIRQVRKIREISQETLAHGIGLTRTSLVNIELGRTGLTAKNIHAISQFLNINPADIFPDTPNSISLLTLKTIDDLKTERDEWKNKYNELTNLLSKLKEHIL